MTVFESDTFEPPARRRGQNGHFEPLVADRPVGPGDRDSIGTTVTFIFAILIVAFNLIADLLYGILDPRIRYD